ncbi:lysis system i-spanin subunit Rz [Diaphorobacter caeni]|uniref:lysis system i-spanin subunit Rz n=1 Tax=Diaphorobacter caeni TaxID=2784387 RepID=UPI00188F732A|nr:lysis system i-spanin subunit Rz [Diaphorobacter caeni]MBF5003361.1 lysis protein [Diaphorobacter caeni]
MTCKPRQRGALDVTIILCACLALAAWVFYAWAEGQGYDRAMVAVGKREKAQGEANETERQRQIREAEDSKKRQRAETDLLTKQLKEAKDHAKTLQAERDRALRAGTRRVSIRAAACVPAVVPTGDAAKSGAAGPQEARAELVGSDAADIYAVTDDGDDAIRELNICIDRYNGAAAEIERYKARLKGDQHVEAAESAGAH